MNRKRITMFHLYGVIEHDVNNTICMYYRKHCVFVHDKYTESGRCTIIWHREPSDQMYTSMVVHIVY